MNSNHSNMDQNQHQNQYQNQCPSSPYQYQYQHPSIMKCRLLKTHEAGFGFNVKPNKSSLYPSLVVSDLIKNGEADKSGLIRPGDLILKINDYDVSQCSYDDGLKLFKLIPADSVVSFVIKAPMGYTTRLETTFASDGSPRTLRITEKIIRSFNEIKITQPDHEHASQPIVNHNDESENVKEKFSAKKRCSIGNKESLNNLTLTTSVNSNHQHHNKDTIVNCENEKSHHVNKRATKLKNLTTGQVLVDTLHHSAYDELGCTSTVCSGSIVNQASFTSANNNKAVLRDPEEILKQAKHFIEQYYSSIKRLNSKAHQERWNEIVKEVNDNGTYNLKETELIFGAKLAWRNAPRCIGRIQWSKLQVFDSRSVTTAREMFEALCNHIKYATNKGNLRSAITIFPQRKDDHKNDFRVWNIQLISYAGYANPETGQITGDPLNVEFTQLCEKLGWKGKGTKWDVLPLVLSAGQDPEVFPIPEELIVRIPILHPSYPWFKDLDLQWYGLPAVSNMLFDVGGLEFPACPFSGWYMETEIAARDLCDVNRYNILEEVAKRLGLDVRSNSTLWKDRALTEVNIAVLDSYQKANVTIVDHHTASESFMKHLENEQKLRGGCPADWVWIVPPTAGSLTPVFHQEMLYYQLKPSYEYQEPAWKTHVWQNIPGSKKNSLPFRKLKFKEIARAVKFTSNLFGKQLSKRIKATILYATETGRSEIYAKRLAQIFSHGFNVSVMCMDSYDMSHLEHEALLLIITSTFGNGDPPENGESFARHLQAIKMTGDTTPDIERVKNISTSYLRISVDTGDLVPSYGLTVNQVGLLSNIRYAVFALGSSAYPNFCAFGRYIDTILADLGGERIMKVGTGDELCGQEQSFGEWSRGVFEIACEVFCLSDDISHEVMKRATLKPLHWSEENVRLEPVNYWYPNNNFCKELSKGNRKVVEYKLINRTQLHDDKVDGRTTILVELEAVDPKDAPYYLPGDHIGIYPENRTELVNEIIEHLPEYNADQNFKVLVKKHNLLDDNNDEGEWVPYERFSVVSLREALTRYLDITTPPTQQLLNLLQMRAEDEIDKRKLKLLSSDSNKYEDWKAMKYPNLLEILIEFPSVKFNLELIFTQLPVLQSRFYSISSSPLKVSPARIDLTIAVVTYTTYFGGKHYGVCSNFLFQTEIGNSVFGFIRSAPNFRIPDDNCVPIIMVGPGSGIAPFRAFWQHREIQMKMKDNEEFGKMTLFFGCRCPSMQLHSKEVLSMVNMNVITENYTAFSRIKGYNMKYVQDCLKNVSQKVYQELIHEKGHIYVCGDVSMAEDVSKTIKLIIEENGVDDGDSALVSLKENLRYHEDIFGITLRTAEMTKKGRNQAMVKRSLSNA